MNNLKSPLIEISIAPMIKHVVLKSSQVQDVILLHVDIFYMNFKIELNSKS